MKNDAIATARLRAIKRFVRAGERVLNQTARTIGRDTKAERHIDAPTGEDQRLRLQMSAHFFNRRLRLPTGAPMQADGELLAAEPADHVTPFKLALQDRRNAFKHLIADRMAETIVH